MNWWRRLLRRKQIEEQLDKELRFHLERQVADLIAGGHDPEQARRLARLAFGGPEQIKEECRDARGTRWVEDFGSDVRHALRGLRHNRGFAAIALLTLALGTGATTVMFSVVDGVLLKPLPYREAERLVAINGSTEKYGENWGFSYLDFLDVQRQSQSLDAAAWNYGGGTVSGHGEAEYIDGSAVSSGLFPALGIRLVRGRAFRPEEDRHEGSPVMIISSRLWQRRFGGAPEAIGSSLTLEGKSYTVVGIAPTVALFGDSDVFTPLGQSWADPRMQNRGSRFIRVIARIRSGASLASAQTELNLIGRRLAEQYPRFDAGHALIARPLGRELAGDVRPTLWLLLGAVGLVLLIACANIASLILARAVSREREIAMRAALGAGRGRLVRQSLTESLVLAFAGGGLGVLVAAVGIRPFVALWPGSLPRAEEIGFDWRVLLFALAASILSGAIFGLAPALRAPARELERALRAGARNVAASSRGVHGGFVVGQLALAVVLLVSAGVLGRTLLHLASLDPGVDLRNVVTARVAPAAATLTDAAAMRASWKEFLDQTRRVPGVERATLTDIVPMRAGQNFLPFSSTPEMPPPDRAPVALASCVTPDYLEVMGLRLKGGRFFTEQDRLDGVPVVVIDEVMAQHAFGRREAVGRQLWMPALSRAPVQVIGVVGHVRHWGLAGDDHSSVRDQVYYPLAQVPDRLMRLFSSLMSAAVRTKIEPSAVIDPWRRATLGSTGDRVLYEVRTLDELAGASLARQRFLLLLFGIFAGLALLLACIGLYGVLAYLTSRRVPEIGVRMALGANSHQVMWMVLRQSLWMICAGAGLGLLGAIAAARLLQRFVEGVGPAEPSTFGATMAALGVAALVAGFLPARRASRVDPIAALRQD
ncbi:MAG TPA: ABC transporter permease [Bryobacteraceae bacterium]|jgi:predicted permease